METKQEQIIKKFEYLSDKYHKMSLLFYELSQSLKIETAKYKYDNKGLKKYLKDKLNLDMDKILKISVTIKDISMDDLKNKKEVQ